jgi:rhodanese-related sulfurtransferase
MNEENVGKRMVEEAQAAVPATPIEIVYSKLQQDEDLVILDVREPTEWINGHIKEATLLSRGLIEGRIENIIPDKDKIIFVH